jgi:hypothetical protein
VAGALPLPIALGPGAQLDAVRSPGSYVALTDSIANSAGNLPLPGIGAFTLLVIGDPMSNSVTVQKLQQKATGDEYSRVFSNDHVLVPWFLSASPAGTNLAFSGLYAFRVIDGRLKIYYRDGDDPPPDFHIEPGGHLIAGVDGAEVDIGLVRDLHAFKVVDGRLKLCYQNAEDPPPAYHLDPEGHLIFTVDGGEIDLGLIKGAQGDPAPAPSFYLDEHGHLIWEDNIA